MKWKLTVRYLFSIFIIVFIVMIVNTFVLIGLLYYQQYRGLEQLGGDDGETFTRQFDQYLSIDQEQPIITKEGISALQSFGGWAQVLDENGTVITSALTPDHVLSHYSPIDLVHKYKYMDEDFTTLFIGEFESYSYIIGVPQSKYERIVVTFNFNSITSFMTKAIASITIVDLLIAMLIGFLFSAMITKPVSHIIYRISQLKKRDFTTKKITTHNIYNPVFANLNDVSKTLQSHEEERIKLEKMREEWISNVSHDLKTPLASIQGYAELLSDKNINDSERLEYAEVIERKSIFMKELLDDFNLTMRLRNQDIPLQLKETKVDSFIREIIIEILNDPQFSESNISFINEVDDLSWNIDHHLMKRAILNFIYNALFHNDENVTVTVRVTKDGLFIHDDGKGIATEELDQIFDRYYRGTNTESIEGTGLGLAIARDIIEAHGGTVTLLSELGKGTQVKIAINK